MFVPLLIVGGLIFEVYSFNQVTYVEGKVVDKYTKKSSESDKFYIVVEEDGVDKVITNEDSLFQWKFDSADIQAKIKVGDTYKFKLRGLRVPILSAFPNLSEADLK
ncbi:hypothetical protein CN555_21340 [Bacillus wiedmannii]|nr:hypothetical protein CN555_21340 [Bacillus wiedmannii]